MKNENVNMNEYAAGFKSALMDVESDTLNGIIRTKQSYLENTDDSFFVDDSDYKSGYSDAIEEICEF